MELPMASIEKLRKTLIEEIDIAFGLKPGDWRSRLLEPLFWLPAQRLAELGARFDAAVSGSGLQDAVRWVLPRFVQNLEVQYSSPIPESGPLLVASNHPGTYDSLAIVANLPRDDLKIVASNIPFIRNLPSVSPHMIFTTQNPHERMTVIRSTIRHLVKGGAVLIFPSGYIDPDPAVLPGAAEALKRWSRSLEIILKRVPQTHVLVTIVSGMLAPQCIHNPLVRLQKHLRDQLKLAEFIQVIQQMALNRQFTLTPRITFGDPIPTQDLLRQDQSPDLIPKIIAAAHQLLGRHTTASPEAS
jgi:hypothetical protein